MCSMDFLPRTCLVRSNERTDALACEATNESVLTLDPQTDLALVNERIDQNRVDTDFTTHCLKERGVPRGAERKCNLRGQARRISNQLLIGTVSPSTLSWLLQRRDEHLLLCPRCNDSDSTSKYIQVYFKQDLWQIS